MKTNELTPDEREEIIRKLREEAICREYMHKALEKKLIRIRSQEKFAEFLKEFKQEVLREQAQKAGSVKSAAKQAAVRENGKKGGRPPKNPVAPSPERYIV